MCLLTSGVSGDAELIELYDVEVRNAIPRSKEKKLSSRSSKVQGGHDHCEVGTLLSCGLAVQCFGKSSSHIRRCCR
ncbi:hypothetical protein V8C44DRAFT_324004 [Trichoderma aethiopicum]